MVLAFNVHSFTKIINYFLPAASIRTEGNRLKAEIKQLIPFRVPETDIDVHYRFAPTMIDGKVRKVWTDVTNAPTNCPICGATPTQMSKPKGVLHDFVPFPGALQYSCGGVHGYLRSFDWFNKTRFHHDFKLWSCV